MPRRTLATLAVTWMLAFPAVNAWAAVHGQTKPRKKVVKVTKTVTGPAVPCKRWGPLQVRIKVKKTTTIIGSRKRVAIKIIAIDFPIVSDSTFKTRYINKQALPLLVEEVLEIQNAKIEVISGATDTSVSFRQSLQAALLSAKKK